MAVSASCSAVVENCCWLVLVHAGVELKQDATEGGTLSYTHSDTSWHGVGVEVGVGLDDAEEPEELVDELLELVEELDEELEEEELEELCAKALVELNTANISKNFFIIAPQKVYLLQQSIYDLPIKYNSHVIPRF